MNAPYLSSFSQTVIKKIKSEQKVSASAYNPDYPDFLFVSKDDDLFDGDGSPSNNGGGTSNGGGTIISGGGEPSNVVEPENNFNAKGECFIIAEIEGIDFVNFSLDDQEYIVSYGLNVIPVKFTDEFKSYQIVIDQLNLPYFKSLVVEPLFIVEGEIEVSLEQDTEVSFHAGGPISILTRINFPYNWLYVELQNETGESTILKRTHHTNDYPEVDPLFYCMLVEQGAYIRYDVDLEPGEYNLLLRGNGSIEGLIMVNSDWDGDLLNDVEEIQKQGFGYELDPTIPDAWGFYQHADKTVYFSEITDDDYTEGHFTFHAPPTATYHRLEIKVNSGQFKEMTVNNDSLWFEGQVFDSSNGSVLYGFILPGWHNIYYKHKVDAFSEINFLLNDIPVEVLEFPELRDTDGDGLKDIEEFSNGLDPSKVDTDEDGIPDNLDSSPLAKLELDSDQIHQFVIPTNESKDSIINIQIKKPEIDYSTNGVPRLWKYKYNVSIYPVLRLFGSTYELTFFEDQTPMEMSEYDFLDTKFYRYRARDYAEWYYILNRYCTPWMYIFDTFYGSTDVFANKPYYVDTGSWKDWHTNQHAYEQSNGVIMISEDWYNAGNKLETLLTIDELERLWDKELNCVFKSDEALDYDHNWVGDPLPTSTNNPEFSFVFPKPATESIDYSVMIPSGHSSKMDGLLDLRFDIIWLVTYFNEETRSQNLLHYYDFEENIQVQSLTNREVANASYILGSPDNFIESQILWNLNQNPALGTPEEFNVQSDIVGQGNVNFFDVIECAANDRLADPLQENESEVLYITSLFQNYDVLNKISLQNLPTADFETTYQGDYEGCISFYSISNLYDDQEYGFGDTEIEGEQKILYQTYYKNVTENSVHSVENRAGIMGIPIAMEVCVDSNVLKVTQARGVNVPLNEIPWEESNLGDKTTAVDQIYIDRNPQLSGVPIVTFEVGVDFVKEYASSRIQETEQSDLFFSSHSFDAFQTAVDEYWNLLDSAGNSLSVLYDLVKTLQLPTDDIEDHVEQMIDKIDVFKEDSYLGIDNQFEFFQFAQQLELDGTLLAEMQFDYHLDELDYIPRTSAFYKFGKGLDKVFTDIRVLQIKKFIALQNFRIEEENILLGKFLGEGELESNLIPDYKPPPPTWKMTLKGCCIGAAGALLGAFMIYHSVQEISNLLAKNNAGEYDDEQVEFYLRCVKAVGSVIIGALVGTSGVLLLVKSIGDKLAWNMKILTNLIKYLGYITFAITVVLFLIDTIVFFKKLMNNEVGFEEVAYFVMSALGVAAGAMLLAGGAIAIAGAALGLAIAGVALIFMIVNHLLNDPDISINTERTMLYFPEETKLNLRRNGGLEAGDVLGFILACDIGGKNPWSVRVRIRFDEKLNSPAWKGTWTDDDWVGFWDHNPNDEPWGVYVPGWGSWHSLQAPIAGASKDLLFRMEVEADWWRLNIARKWKRETGFSKSMWQFLGISVFENTISEFYASTTEFVAYSNQFEEFYELRDEFQYKDAYTTVIALLNQIKRNGFINLPFGYGYSDKMTPSARLLEKVGERLYGWDEDYMFLPLKLYSDWYDYDDYADFYSPRINVYDRMWNLLLGAFVFSGVEATDPYDKDYVFEYDRHFFADVSSNFQLKFPKYWYSTIEPHVQAFFEAEDLVDTLPLRTNVMTDYLNTAFDVDHVSDEVDVSFVLDLEPHRSALDDLQKEVVFNITAPGGFSISEDSFTAPLSSTIQFTLTHNSPLPLHGVYHFHVAVYTDEEAPELIYKESVPIIITGFTQIDIAQKEATEPVVPGDIFYAVNITNSGTYEETINVTVTGIPESFVYQGLYPNDFINNSQIFDLIPGESREVLIINPPRRYTTTPGNYMYFVRVHNYAYTMFDETVNGTFEVAKFYDMDIHCLTPDLTIFDYETGVYTYNLTNWGNVEQTFNITSDDVAFAEESLSDTTIMLGSGGSQLFTLTLTPIGWGEQTFSVYAASDFNSDEIEADITILDDDLNPPEFTNFEIIDTPINVTVNFEVLNENEGDDCGLSNIKIFFDNELLLNYNPDSIETSFSFTFDDTHGGWFMEHGTHEVRVDIVDNDFDVPNDALSSTTSGEFNTTLEDIHGYINWQLEVLKEYIDDNLYSCLSWFWSKKINCAQKHLAKAFDYIEDGRIVCGLFHDHVAKVMVQIVEFRTEIFTKFDLIDEVVADHIVNSTHVIRNNIVLLMGYTTGTEIGYRIALVEIDLLNLNDLIEEKVNRIYRFRWCLKNHIRSATYRLEYALVKVSLGLDIYCTLTQALEKLDRAKSEVERKLNRGEISQELADLVLLKLEQAQEDIIDIQNSI